MSDINTNTATAIKTDTGSTAIQSAADHSGEVDSVGADETVIHVDTYVSNSGDTEVAQRVGAVGTGVDDVAEAVTPPRKTASILVKALVAMALLASGFAIKPLFGHSDSLTQDEINQRAAAWEQVAGNLPLPAIDISNSTQVEAILAEAAKAGADSDTIAEARAEVAAELALLAQIHQAPALAASTEPVPAQAIQVQQATQTQQVRTKVLMLWDSNDVDGDTVRVTTKWLDGSIAFSKVVVLKAAPTALFVTVPVGASGVGTVELVGVHDGGGGITVGLQSATGGTNVRIMAEGETVSFVIP